MCRKVELQLPQDVPEGQHQLVIVVDTKDSPSEKSEEPLPMIHVNAWPSSLSLRREDLYNFLMIDSYSGHFNL